MRPIPSEGSALREGKLLLEPKQRFLSPKRKLRRILAGGAAAGPAAPGALRAGGAPAPRPARPGGSRNRIRGLGRAAAASHGPASRAAQVHLVRLHRPGRGEERQGLQIPAQSESPGARMEGGQRAAGRARGCFASPRVSTEKLLNIKNNKIFLLLPRWFW